MPRGTHARPSRLRMARRRGAIAGPLLMLLGAWGALVPFFGHSFGYGYTPDDTWGWTAARGWLEVLPGAATLVGGAILTMTAHRLVATVGGWLAAAGGAWFVLGTVVSPWWSPGYIGTATGGTDRAVFAQIGMFTGLGVVIAALAGFALGRISVIGVRDLATGQEQLDAYRRIEQADPAPSELPPPTVDLTKAEPLARTANDRPR